jgi:hypothetical protein
VNGQGRFERKDETSYSPSRSYGKLNLQKNILRWKDAEEKRI